VSAAAQHDGSVDLSCREPDFIRTQLPGMWLLASVYFRAQVRGLDRVPEDRPVLVVANHSGGNMTPDTIVFMLAWNTYFGVERPIYALAHKLVTAAPLVGSFLRRWGVVTAGHDAATTVLEAGHSVLVYPGGDVEVHRPWTARNEIRFDGRQGFIKLAREAGVPIVPVVSSGGHDTYLPLTDGRWLAKALRLDKVARLKVLPISLALPWGLNIGDFLGHLPLPAKIRVEVLDPIDVADAFGDDDDAAYAYITDLMQETLISLAAEDVATPFA
jgi:1-acyl-sn-glycerol-3-phosphate acyltransferase